MVLLSIICLWPGHQRYNPLSHAVFWPEHPAVFEICQFVGVTHTSPTTYYRFQKLYAAPTVHQVYKSMETRVVEECRNKEGII